MFAVKSKDTKGYPKKAAFRFRYGQYGRQYFELSAKKDMPVMMRSLAAWGLEPDSEQNVRREVESVLDLCHGRGRLLVYPHGREFLDAMAVWDAEKLKKVHATFIGGGLSDGAIGTVIKNGVLDARGRIGTAEIRVLPVAPNCEDYGSMEPVGLFYDMSQGEQLGALVQYCAQYPKTADVRAAEPIEIGLALLADRIRKVKQYSIDVIFALGEYRTAIEVPSGDQSWLSVYCRNGRLWLVHDRLGCISSTGVVASVGISVT